MGDVHNDPPFLQQKTWTIGGWKTGITSLSFRIPYPTFTSLFDVTFQGTFWKNILLQWAQSPFEMIFGKTFAIVFPEDDRIYLHETEIKFQHARPNQRISLDFNLFTRNLWRVRKSTFHFFSP